MSERTSRSWVFLLSEYQGMVNGVGRSHTSGGSVQTDDVWSVGNHASTLRQHGEVLTTAVRYMSGLGLG